MFVMPFQDDPDQSSRTEDSIIAYTWNLFVQEVYPEPEVILQFPMTKATKYFDTIQSRLIRKYKLLLLLAFIVSLVMKINNFVCAVTNIIHVLKLVT